MTVPSFFAFHLYRDNGKPHFSPSFSSPAFSTEAKNTQTTQTKNTQTT